MPLAVAQFHTHPCLPLPGTVGMTELLAKQQQQDSSKEAAITEIETDGGERTVECKLQECPELLHDEMMQLFPETSIGRGQLRLIILTERTDNDMTSWSPSVEEEREELLAHVSVPGGGARG